MKAKSDKRVALMQAVKNEVNEQGVIYRKRIIALMKEISGTSVMNHRIASMVDIVIKDLVQEGFMERVEKGLFKKAE